MIDHPLTRLADDARATARALTVQPARTRFRTLGRWAVPLPYGDFAQTRCALLELQPETGRRHQLRRHCKHIGHPIIGDATHGKGPLNRALAGWLGLQRLWLHASTLVLPHPVREVELVPEDIPLEVLYEDDQVVAFYDINPQAKVHFLVVPKKHIQSAAALTEEDGALLGHIFAVIAKLAKEVGLDNGYRVISNVGEDAGQTVKHLHFHVLGGEKLPV